MSKSLFIFLSALCFFAIQEAKPRFFHWEKPLRLKGYLPGLPPTDSPGKRMWTALVTGEKKVLRDQENELYLRLGITHIFTPSGMHLTTLTLFISKGRVFKMLSALLASLLGAISLFPAMGRVLWLKIMPCSFASFCFIMILEGILFSWQHHNLSWICSWLFLGFCYFSPSSHRALWFSLGQMLLCHIFFQEWSLLGILMNVLMVILLQMIFPVVLTLSFLPKLPQDQVISLLDHLYQCLVFIDSIHRYLSPFIPHLGHLFLLLLWILLVGRARLLVLPMVLFSLSAPLNQQKISTFSQAKWESVASEKVKCRFKWRNQRWEEGCRPRKRERHI
jgi:predicted membrane metal-binding protein